MRALASLAACVCGLSMFGALIANAQDIRYPREVEASLEFARKDCKEAEGTGTTFGKNAVRAIELTGDGRADYIVSLEGAECEGVRSHFCGTGGCGLEILVARPKGTYVSVFDMRVRSYEILPGKGAKRIRFELHGSYCGRSGVQSCYKTRRITAKPFQLREPE